MLVSPQDIAVIQHLRVLGAVEDTSNANSSKRSGLYNEWAHVNAKCLQELCLNTAGLVGFPERPLSCSGEEVNHMRSPLVSQQSVVVTSELEFDRIPFAVTDFDESDSIRQMSLKHGGGGGSSCQCNSPCKTSKSLFAIDPLTIKHFPIAFVQRSLK
jgi:hypothetical protein